MTITAREQFDRQATFYNNRWASWSDESLKSLLTLAEPQPNWHVLDVATGTGFTALALAPHVHAVVGTDVSPGMLTQAAKRAQEAGVGNIFWQEAPAEALPFADGSFDLVTCRIAPHHFQSMEAFLKETVRVLRPGGVFVVADTTVPDEDAETAEWQNRVEKLRDPSHVRNLSPSEWRKSCESAGLVVTDENTLSGAIPLELSGWLETAGCTGDAAESVRQAFANAPVTAKQLFQIQTTQSGETNFAWQRVGVRAIRP